MKQDTAVILGTPAIAAVVFGSASAAAFAPILGTGQAWSAFGGGMVVGWIAGQIALQALVNPEVRLAARARRYELEALRRPSKPTTFILPPQTDGFTPRVSSGIALETWQEVARIVVQLKCKNLSQDVLALALRDMAQGEIRKLHMQMIGLLKPAGVINQKGNHNEITEPEGRWFFLRMDTIKSPDVLDAYSLPASPRLSPSAQGGDSEGHTRGPRANYGSEGGYSQRNCKVNL